MPALSSPLEQRAEHVGHRIGIGIDEVAHVLACLDIPLIVFVVEFAVADGKQAVRDFAQLPVRLCGLDAILDAQTSKRQQFLQDIDVHIVADEFFGDIKIRGVRTPAFDDVIAAGIDAVFGDELQPARDNAWNQRHHDASSAQPAR